MNLEQLKKNGWIIYDVIVGSHLYGTNKEGSDTDTKGIFIQPTKEILAGNYISQVSDDKQDTTYYEIGRFIELISGSNPNMLDVLGSDKIIYDNGLFRKYFPDNNKFLTSKIKHTFSGYAYSQIQKAKGYNKKVNWEKSRTERKDVLDFCYILLDKEDSIKIKDFFEVPENTFIETTHWGLAKINNFPDCYSMYYFPDGNGGIISEDSNDVQLREIPIKSQRKYILRFDKAAYSTHCKDFREYQQWLIDRNPLRYADNAKVGNDFDSKNMSHCIRLLNTSIDLLSDKGLILKRPEKDYLISIRNGEVSYETIINEAETKMELLNSLYETTTLPREVDSKYISDLLLQIRLEHL
ncbi:MAG TPA: nucleotidyltransferase domain-containing protein [Burkholderiales bacterium]|nr:nucleotidyltransferase domain-containing protein [Burkholderiales bacterium]